MGALLIALAAGTATAHADAIADFGAHGHLIISADRLSPLFSYERIHAEDNTTQTTDSTWRMSILWSGQAETIYEAPRIGIDYVVAPSVTVGGTLFFTIPFSSTHSVTMNNNTTSRDSTKFDALALEGRVGYIMPIAPKIAFWPRGGLSYSRTATTNPFGNNGDTTSTVISEWAIQLEPMFVYSVTTHFGVQFGPVLDLPFSGTQHQELTMGATTTSTDTTLTETHFGITVGLLGEL